MSLIDSPAFRVIRQGRAGRFRITSPMRYGWIAKRAVVEVPIGTETDFASIPRPFRNIFSINGRHRLPAVLHDYLYGRGGEIFCGQSYCALDGAVDRFAPLVITYSRKEADQVFRQAMREEGVGAVQAWLMYKAVRVFGGLHMKRTGGKTWQK